MVGVQWWKRNQNPTKGVETANIGKDIQHALTAWSLPCGSIGRPPTYSLVTTKELYPMMQELTNRPRIINTRSREGTNNGQNRDPSFSSPVSRREFPVNMQTTGRTEGEEPSPVIPRTEIQQRSEFSVASGGFSDIYLAHWKGIQVGIKMLRIFSSQSNEKIERRLNREIKIWKRLRNWNIAAFYGAVYEPNGRVGIVMHWYKNGTAPSYIIQQRGKVDIRKMLLDVGHGLQYLHSLCPPIVHGDLKGCNTLVSDTGRVVISDFGLSRLVREVHGPSGMTTTTIAGSLRFQAPELLQEETSGLNYPVVPRFPSDIYAFGCTIYELVTGQVPYQHLKADWHVIKAITQGTMPLRHDDSTIFGSPGLEELLHACWQFSPDKRPSVGEVLEHLEQVQFASLEYRFR